jgi:hypothetical protein
MTLMSYHPRWTITVTQTPDNEIAGTEDLIALVMAGRSTK